MHDTDVNLRSTRSSYFPSTIDFHQYDGLADVVRQEKVKEVELKKLMNLVLEDVKTTEKGITVMNRELYETRIEMNRAADDAQNTTDEVHVFLFPSFLLLPLLDCWSYKNEKTACTNDCNILFTKHSLNNCHVIANYTTTYEDI